MIELPSGISEQYPEDFMWGMSEEEMRGLHGVDDVL
jgi:hypothetical protein